MAGRPCETLMGVKVSAPGWRKKRPGSREDCTSLREGHQNPGSGWDPLSLLQRGFDSAPHSRETSTQAPGGSVYPPVDLESWQWGTLNYRGFQPSHPSPPEIQIQLAWGSTIFKELPSDSNAQPKLKTTVWECASKEARAELEGQAERNRCQHSVLEKISALRVFLFSQVRIYI